MNRSDRAGVCAVPRRGMIPAMSPRPRKSAQADAGMTTARSGVARGSGKPATYTISALASAAGTNVRNIRAYQDRGLIPPPEKKGRQAIYREEHLGRLRVIAQMLERGYTLTSIGDLFEALAQGHDIADLMGLGHAVSSPWTDETPKTYTLVELMKMFRGNFSPRWLMHATDLGILEQKGAKFRAPSPRMLHAASELVNAGIPLDDMLSVVRKLRSNVESTAEDMVRLVERHCFDKYGPGLPPADKVPELADLVWRLRPLVEMGVLSEVARAMEAAANKHLGDRLSFVLEEIGGEPPHLDIDDV